MLSGLAGIYARWRRDLAMDIGADEFANAASIQRWEAAGLMERLRSTPPPPELSRQHGDLAAVAADTARAAQLLSNGYRFHSSRARCDGQALMLAAEQRFATICGALEQRGISVPRDGDDVPPAR